MLPYETLTEIRKTLIGHTIKRVQFSRTDGEIRGLALRLDDGTEVVLTATTYQSIKVESA